MQPSPSGFRFYLLEQGNERDQQILYFSNLFLDLFKHYSISKAGSFHLKCTEVHCCAGILQTYRIYNERFKKSSKKVWILQN